MAVDDSQLSAPLLKARSSEPSKTRIIINVYDLIPPSRMADLLWNLGAGLVHTGVVIGDREYAYGAHEKPGTTGVYWSRPGLEPPGGTFRTQILQGFSFRDATEIQTIIDEASHKFQGTSWNLLRNNCNHFTSHLCQTLTGKAAPAFLNRAASIGICIPCIVPQEWITAPDAETADGALVQVDSEDENAIQKLDLDAEDSGPEYDEVQMSDADETEDDLRTKWRRKRRKYHGSYIKVPAADDEGQPVPPSERAPVPPG